MALERLVEQLFILRGYWTRTRVPIQTRKGSYSDLDVLAFKEGRVVVAECKGVGTSDEYRPLSSRKWTEDTVRKLCDEVGDTFSLTESVECAKLGLKRVNEVHFVLPGFFEDESDRHRLCGLYPKRDFKITVNTIDEVLKELWSELGSSMRARGRRYNEPALELMRWTYRSRTRVDWPKFLEGAIKAFDEAK